VLETTVEEADTPQQDDVEAPPELWPAVAVANRFEIAEDVEESTDVVEDDDDGVGTGTLNIGQMPLGRMHSTDLSHDPAEASSSTPRAKVATSHHPCSTTASVSEKFATETSTPEEFATEMSMTPAESSTPGRGRRSPALSPLPRHLALPPSKLVCYIWNQTRSLTNSSSSTAAEASPRRRESSSTAMVPETSGTSTPAAGGGCSESSPSWVKRCLTPFTLPRGNWDRVATGTTPHDPSTPTLSVVVKNTFVEIEDPAERGCRSPGGPQRCRSLSPSLLGREDAWPDFCHWHT